MWAAYICTSGSQRRRANTMTLFLLVQLIVTPVVILAQNAEPGPKDDEGALDDEEDADIDSKSLKSEILKNILGETYDTQIRPPGEGGHGPTIVSLNILIRSIENLDDVEMQFRVQITYRQDWIDPRLKFSHIHKHIPYLSLVKWDKVWMPDLFFANEKEGYLHELMVPNVFTRIYPNGRVLQSYRITLTLSCPMNLRKYPLDEQVCPIRLTTYGTTTRDVVLRWSEDGGVEMAGATHLPRFKLKDYSNETCDSVTRAGAFPCLQIQLGFTRQLGYYFIQVYIPTSFIVIVSWISFWLEPTATEARVSLGVTTILTVVTETYGINQSVPPASYIKAVDVWTTTCELLVFAVLLQFSIVNYVSRFQWQKKLKYLVDIHEVETRRSKEISLMEKYQRKAARIDLISKILFPSLFIIFNIIYWTTYLSDRASSYAETTV